MKTEKMIGKTMTKFETGSLPQLDVVALYLYSVSQAYRDWESG